MGKYEDITRSFYDDYEQPVIEDYIVGFSGLDPDRKVKPETIDHEKLDGLLGGDFSGRYHLTNDELRKFTGYQGQIDKNKQDSETALTELRTDTDNAVTNLRTATNNEIQQLRTDTNNAVTTLRNDSNQAISELREDSETADREIRSETEKSIRGLKAEKDREIQNLNMDLNTAKSVMGQQVSQISQRQEAVEATQANISARFDEALEGITEDSEVIDARVDAENTRHVNLGANVRSLHRRVMSADKTAHERDAGLYSHFQEQADTLSGEVLRHTLEIDANEKRISASEAEIASTGERLSEEIQTRRNETETRKNEDEEIRQELRESISQARKDTASRSENLQEQAGTLAGEVLRLELQRQEDNSQHGKDIEALQLDIAKSRKISELGQEHLQKQSDDLAGAVLDSAIQIYGLDNRLRDETEYRKSDTRYLTGEIAKEARERFLSDEALNDDMYEEYRTRAKADDELRTDISASRRQTQAVYEQLREQADTLSGEVLRQKFEREADREHTAQELRDLEKRTTGKIVHEQRQRTAYDEHLQEQANDLAQAELTNVYSIIQEGNERRKLAASLKEQISDWENKRNQAEKRMREGLSEVSASAAEAANDNAAAILRIAFQMIENAQEQKSYQAAIREELKQRSRRIYDWISGLQEQINELAYLQMYDLNSSQELISQLSRIDELERVIQDLVPQGIDSQVMSVIDDVFAGNSGEHYEDPEYDGMIDDVFQGNSGDHYEDPEFDELIDGVLGVNP